MTRRFTKNRNSEKGIALLIAIFTLLLLTAIGAGMVAMTNTDTSISANFRDEQTAFFAAKAGLEEVRDRFRTGASNSLSSNAYFGSSALPGQANGVLYITNTNPATSGETITPWVTNSTNASVYPDDEICTELFNIGTPCSSGAPSGSWYMTTTNSTSYAPIVGTKLPWKWVRIAAKTNLTSSGTSSTGSTLASVDGNTTAAHASYRVCWTGSQEVAISNTSYASCAAYPVTPTYLPIYTITALAQTPTGSRRMVQAEVSAQTFPSVPGPLVFDGSSPAFSVPSSNKFIVNGNDDSSPTNASGPGASCPSGRPAEYALGGFNAASATTLQTLADANRPNNYTGILNPNGTTNIASAGDVSSQLGSLATVGGLQSLVSSATLVAGNEGNVYGNNPATITNPGTIASPQVNVVQGNLTLSGNWTGAGILLVTGNLTLSGTPSYEGLILVIGTGTVTKNGGGNATVDGSMLMANLYNSSGTLLPSTSAPGIPNFTWNGGGTMTMNYDSCWSSAMGNMLAWRVVGVREIIR